MEELVALGTPGLHAHAGDHICVLTRGPKDREALLLPFMQQGILSGDNCVCVVETAERDRLMTALAPRGDACASGLRILDWNTTYLRGGSFSPERMVEFWQTEILSPTTEPGHSILRAACDMSWVVPEMPSVSTLAWYEGQINRLPHGDRSFVALCMYDVERSSGEMVVEMLQTHPKVLMNGMLFENPYYLEVDESAVPA